MKTFNDLNIGDRIWTGPGESDSRLITAVSPRTDGGKSFEVNNTAQGKVRKEWYNVSAQQLCRHRIQMKDTNKTIFSSRESAARWEMMVFTRYAEKLKFRISRNQEELKRLESEIEKLKSISEGK